MGGADNPGQGGGSPSTSPAALSVLTVLGPPVTIATALMVYFGWDRSFQQARYMGLDVSLFGYSTQDYALRSIDTLYIPLLVLSALALGWLGVHERLLRELRQVPIRPWVLVAGRLTRLSGLVLAGAAAVLAIVLGRGRTPLLLPLAIAVGTALAAYGAWWGRAASAEPVPAPPAWRRALRGLLLGAVITLALFWQLSSYATIVGKGDALDLARHVSSRPSAVAYSTAVLHIEAPGVHEERLAVAPGSDPASIRYRTTGLRLLAHSGGRMFLVYDGWTPRSGTVIVLPDDDQVRWQFSR